MKEKFSLELFTDPKKFFEDIIIDLIIFLVKVIIFGYIIYYTMKKTGLTEEATIKNYVKYFVAGSLALYTLSMLNMIYDCYMAGVEVHKMRFTSFAKASTFVFVFTLVHIIALVICTFLKLAPLLGFIVYELAWGSTFIVLITGIVYNLTYDGVLMVNGCPQTK